MLSNERKLWLPQGKNQILGVQNSIICHRPLADREAELRAMIEKFSTKPPHKSLWTLFCNSLVVGQEFALACLLLAGHRVGTKDKEEEQQQLLWEQLAPLLPVSVILFCILKFKCRETNSPSPEMMKTWAKDAILRPTFLSLLAAGLKTLTASYSSDTVHALALGGMVVHVLCCDYAYANGLIVSAHSTPGSDHGRRPFPGGTFSLNAALFSTTLLASRLSSNSAVYIFTSTSVIVFAFYPAARHSLSKQPHAPYVLLAISSALLFALWVLLHDTRERVLVVGTVLTICFIAPAWKHHLQSRKVIISGPWDIAHITIENS